MNKLMPRLEALTTYTTQLDGFAQKRQALNAQADTMTVKDYAEQMKALEHEESKTVESFNNWMTAEFEFPATPLTMPFILKTVLEKTIDAPRLITL